MEKPLISVLTAVRNQAPHLPTWLAHLEQQNYPSARFEIVIADHGSTDNTADLAERSARGGPVPTRTVRLDAGPVARGYNIGLREASGKFVLFLSPLLLASPNLVARHAAEQTRSETARCIIGAVRPHPQLAPGALTYWYLPEDQTHCEHNRPGGFLDWQINNLSLPRRMALDAGGLDEGLALSEFEGAELAWRLRHREDPGICCDEALAYAARGITFEEAYARQYARGYCLHRLIQITQSRDIPRRFLLQRNRLRQLADQMIVPFYERACRQAEPDTRLLGAVYRRTLRHARRRGFLDAKRGRPPLDLEP